MKPPDDDCCCRRRRAVKSQPAIRFCRVQLVLSADQPWLQSCWYLQPVLGSQQEMELVLKQQEQGLVLPELVPVLMQLVV